MTATESLEASNGLILNEALFILALLAFIGLLVIEKRKPFRRLSRAVHKQSFVTNMSAFLFNNLILTVLRASSLFWVAQQLAELRKAPHQRFSLGGCGAALEVV